MTASYSAVGGLTSYKVVVVGAPGVGKTCLVRTWARQPLPDHYIPTPRVEVYRVQIGMEAELIIHDVGGTVLPTEMEEILPEADAVVLMYDHSRLDETLGFLQEHWIPAVTLITQASPTLILAVCNAPLHPLSNSADPHCFITFLPRLTGLSLKADLLFGDVYAVGNKSLCLRTAHFKAMARSQAIDELPIQDDRFLTIAHLGIHSPVIHMESSFLHEKCLIDNNRTTLFNSVDNAGEANRYLRKLAVCGFLGTFCGTYITPRQYWQVTVHARPCAGGSLKSAETFAEIGVASLPAINTAYETITPSKSKAFTQRLAVHGRGQRSNLTAVWMNQDENSVALNLNAASGDRELSWTGGFLVGSYADRLAVFDVTNVRKLGEIPMQTKYLLPVFNAVHPPEVIGADVRISVESGEALRFTSSFASLLKVTLRTPGFMTPPSTDDEEPPEPLEYE